MGIKIGILNPDGLELSTQKALDVLVDAFAKQNIHVQPCLYTEQLPKADLLIGSYEKSPILRELVEAEQIPLALVPEAIIIQELTIGDNTALWACAFDNRGLLYVLYELAERINAQSVPALYKTIHESPAFKRRSALHLLPLAELKKGLTISPTYWSSYFEMLIKNRFNCLTLVVAPDHPAPVLPYLLSVPEHPEVNPFYISAELRSVNMHAIKAIAELALESGLDFHLGLWNFYSGHSPLPFRIPGLNEENIASYLYLALKQLLFNCPQISGLEFKFEKAPLAPEFCLYTIVQAVLDNGNKISLNFDVNQITSEIIDLLQTGGINTCLTKDGWGSQFCLPYLKDDGKCNSLLHGKWDKLTPGFQLSTSSLLPWGNPDYLYQLISLLKNEGYDSFQWVIPVTDHGINLPNLPVAHDPHARWEFERHWYQFHLCGRLAYHPGTNGDVLIRDFHRRFGEKGNDLAELYHLTGKVLPLYNTIHESLASWPELNTGGLLSFYLRTPSADPALFADCREYVRATLDRTELAKITPPLVAHEFNRIGTEILGKVRNLQLVTPSTEEFCSTEWKQTLLWAKSLGYFALYHSTKLRAALELAFFPATKDLKCLENTVNLLKEARIYWEKLPPSTSKAEQRLLILEDENRIQALLEEYRARGVFLIGFDFGGLPVSTPQNTVNQHVFSDYHIEEGFTFVDHHSAYDPEVGYGWLNTAGLQATPAPAVRLGEHNLVVTEESETNQIFPFENQLFNKMVWARNTGSFQVDLSPGCYQVHLTFCDRSPEPRRHGPMRILLNDQVIAEDLVVSPGKRVDRQEIVEVTDGKLTLSFSCPPNQDWFISALSIHPVAPLITHTPVTTWERGKPLAIQTTVTGINPIGQVILNYQTENERGYHMVIMTPVTANFFAASIPAPYLEQGNFINYYITALDSSGKEVSLGSFDHPFQVHVRKASDFVPTFFHFPPKPEGSDESVTFKCTVRPATEVENVTLYYKDAENKINQVRLEQENAEDEYGVNLSSFQLLPDHVLKYRFVVKFKNGDLKLFPDPLNLVPYYELKTGDD